jgi:16S rRNA (guanine966-N2)-methyltransferase
MRIISGQRRGHKIDGPRPKSDVRPTSDLVRESLFNMVGPLVVDRDIVDLFAGTGAIGLEALSRGARSATFIEKNRETLGLIHRNIAILRYQDRARVRLTDAYRWARAFQAETGEPMAVFLDPPYREYEVHTRQMHELLATLMSRLPDGSVLAIEGGRGLDATILPDFDAWDIRRYGDTQIAILVLTKSGGDAAGRSEIGSTAEPEGPSGEERDGGR